MTSGAEETRAVVVRDARLAERAALEDLLPAVADACELAVCSSSRLGPAHRMWLEVVPPRS